MNKFLKQYANFNNIFDKLFILFLLFSAFIIRLSDFHNLELNSDEYWHLFVANQSSVIDVLKAVGKYEVHMPLSYVIWYFMLKISDNQMWLRMSSFIPYLFLILSSHQFCKAFFNNRNLGLILAFILTFAIGMTSLAVLIRYYSMLMLIIFWVIIFNCWFVKKFKQKYLIYYFIACLFLILLNQFATIIIFCCGLSMLVKSWQEKKFFKKILIGHLLLLLILILENYLIVTEVFTNKLFKNDKHEIEIILKFLTNLPNLFIKFFFGDSEKLQNYLFFTLIYIFYFFIFFCISIIFIIRKNYFYLNIWFFSIFYAIICSYFIDFSFSYLFRRSVYLLIFFILIALYPIKIFYESNFFNIHSKKILNISKILLLISSIYLIFLYKNNTYFRNIESNNEEFETKESQQEYDNILKTSVSDNKNLVVISNSGMWKYLYDKSAKLEIINDYLGVLKFSDEKYVFVSIVNGRFFKYFVKYFNLKNFFNSIKEYDSKNKRYNQYKDIIFVDLCKENYNCVNIIDKSQEDDLNHNNSIELLLVNEFRTFKNNEVDFRNYQFDYGRKIYFAKFDKNFLINYLINEQKK